MRKFYVCVFLTTLIFMLPSSGQAWSEDGVVPFDSGMVDASEAYEEDFEDQRIVDLKNGFATQLLGLMAQISDTPDPLHREQLQKIVHELKVDREIAEKELYLEIALEENDDASVVNFLEMLDSLYDPTSAEIPLTQPVQDPEFDGIKQESSSKNPDDA